MQGASGPCVAAVFRGVEWATTDKRKHARAHGMLMKAWDDLDSSNLTWMPAHTTPKCVGEVKLSSGARLTMLHWRANRLVDALAKLSALQAQDLPHAIRLIKSCEVAVKHAAKLLGRTTYAANHHCVVAIGEDGKQSNRFLRDAMPAPVRPKRRLSPKHKPVTTTRATAPHVAAPSEDGTVLPPPLKMRKVQGTNSDLRQGARQLETVRLRRRVEEIGSALTTLPGSIPASDRIAALRRRVGLAPFPAAQ